MSVRVSVDLALEPAAAFETTVAELCTTLTRAGIYFHPGADGRVLEGETEIGKIICWRPPREISIEWRPADWQPDEQITFELRFEPDGDGTRVTIEQRDWAKLVGDQGNELAGWFSSEVATPLLAASAPRRFGDWLTDRRTRRPSGPQSRQFYRDPLYHRPNFKAILAVLKLKPEDYLVEIGCGGGAFLQEALASGCKAAAIDHSSDMVRVAREANQQAIAEHRLQILEGDATSLPYPDETFTCAVTTGVFGFIANPVKMLAEIERVLAPGGRFVLFTGSKELRGTPAAPEPMASRLYFYEDHELLDLAQKAGFPEAHLEYPDYEPLARAAGVPEEHLALFKRSSGGQLLVAHKV